jgi:predicted DNA binding CopG/RHH family protein
MRKEYDFTNSKKNPYASKLKKQITIRIDENTIKYFKEVAGNTGISYQNLINLYLYECATNKKKLELKWT